MVINALGAEFIEINEKYYPLSVFLTAGHVFLWELPVNTLVLEMGHFEFLRVLAPRAKHLLLALEGDYSYPSIPELERHLGLEVSTTPLVKG